MTPKITIISILMLVILHNLNCGVVSNDDESTPNNSLNSQNSEPNNQNNANESINSSVNGTENSTEVNSADSNIENSGNTSNNEANNSENSSLNSSNNNTQTNNNIESPDEYFDDINTQAVSQPPLLITWDLHSDPFAQQQDLSRRYNGFIQKLDNIEWLLDFIEPYGAKISFLSVGEFMEYCLENTEKCFPYIQKLYDSGGMISTHTHKEYQRGSHDWPDIENPHTDEKIKQVWDSAKQMVDEVIKQLLGVTDSEEIMEINIARGSHVPDNHGEGGINELHAMIADYGYSVLEGGGGDQELTTVFGHIPFNPYRPGNCGTCEDLDNEIITIPQSNVIGNIGEHFGIIQDGSASRKKVEILQALVNRRIHGLKGNDPKVWTYSWGLHCHDINPNTQNRTDIEDLIPWISNELTVTGMAEFASYQKVRAEYYEWENLNPGASSFNYDLDTKDYDKYPYSEWANRFMQYALLDEKIDNDKIHAFILNANSSIKFVIAYAVSERGTLDLSDIFNTQSVKKYRLKDGLTRNDNSSNVKIGYEPVVICKLEDCEAVLALQADTGSDGNNEQPDNNGQCQSNEDCPQGKVCADIVGMCVPDCRLQNNNCPNENLECNESNGICEPSTQNNSNNNPNENCGDNNECEQGFICAPQLERCVPDCRLPSNSCPSHHPECDENSGMCY